MKRDLASSRALNTFLRKLALGLPVNLAVAWLMFSGQQTDTLAFGFIAAVGGSLLATALDPRLSHEPGTPAGAETVESIISSHTSPSFGATLSKSHHA
jgi:hypothetical protein